MALTIRTGSGGLGGVIAIRRLRPNIIVLIPRGLRKVVTVLRILVKGEGLYLIGN